ncbi:hypothetical protein Gotur_026125 [Gossypium turneri]
MSSGKGNSIGLKSRSEKEIILWARRWLKCAK